MREDNNYESSNSKVTKKKWQFGYISAYSIMLWIGGLLLYIANMCFSQNYEPFATYLSIGCVLISNVLFVVNLVLNAKK